MKLSLLMVSFPQLSSKLDCDSCRSAILHVRVRCFQVSSPFVISNELRVHKLKTREKFCDSQISSAFKLIEILSSVLLKAV